MNFGESCHTNTENKTMGVEVCQNHTNYLRSFYPSIGEDITQETNSRYPSGCYVYTKLGAGFGIYFNHALDGTGNRFSRPLCGKFNCNNFSTINLKDNCVLRTYDLACILSDTYRFEAGKSCHRSSGETYGSVSAAKLACNQDSNCKMVANTRCDGKHFKTCMGPIIDSTLGSCVWNKGNNKTNYYQQVCVNLFEV